MKAWDVKSVDVRTAQVWRESKIVREMLCFTIERAVQVWRESKIRAKCCVLQ